MRAILTGKPIVAHKLEDREFIEWLSRKLTGRTFKFEEQHRTVKGLAEHFRKPTVTVYDCEQLRLGDVVWLMEDRGGKDWLHEITDGGGQGALLPNGAREADARPPRVICTVHPEEWQWTVDELTRLGYQVENGDARYTHPRELYVGQGVPL